MAKKLPQTRVVAARPRTVAGRGFRHLMRPIAPLPAEMRAGLRGLSDKQFAAVFVLTIRDGAAVYVPKASMLYSGITSLIDTALISAQQETNLDLLNVLAKLTPGEQLAYLKKWKIGPPGASPQRPASRGRVAGRGR